ncbi:hypothetical protein SEA_MCKLOVIN_44 [Gordonia phage Mcklovin]|uniref:Uncharacterized protein n=2 Tax=Howevirus TaxID=3044733 RepID=A0A0U4JUA1_9CAUD|nr:hypothetical protein PP513_gp48 [Gordonia phage Howe]YP_010654985.1 hypothetical protein PP514_gp44 [Gordonia phage Mcklovin]AZF93233.1 hypothetical protein SEA_ADORA_45 [Gordonia phage Adora]QDF16828.1 hypothetical protein SEA_TWINKLE_47 [Gordonia phage Twinkle]QYC54447.1 hypothetical protein SEA_SHLIM410_46 [Gordonia phage Shlim410]UAJ16297.1 hypothetical protein SEA_HORTENSE_48 [Gordonia phage Hortense]ALY07682.1 hypothetical protein PBI_HOWE_48 [Gordonia phage Howe]
MSAELVDALRRDPLPQEWVDELRDLLDLLGDFSSNDQRARYLLASNFLRDNGDAIAQRSRALDVELGGTDVGGVPDRSIVRALTANFHDHSDTRRCGCGERDSGYSQAQAVAQPDPGGEAGPGTNLPE